MADQASASAVSSNASEQANSGVAHVFFLNDFTLPIACDSCGEVIWGLSRQGYSCSACDFSIHRRCMQTSPKNCLRQPKPTKKPGAERSRLTKSDRGSKSSNKIRFEHCWVEGAIPMTSICSVCSSAILFYDGYECARCESLSHTTCVDTAHACKPRHKNLIFVPELDRATPSAASDTNASTPVSTDSEWELASAKRTPLIAIINSKSGGQFGEELQSTLSNLLSPDQVFLIDHRGPGAVLEQFKGVRNLRILVAGGDGTVGWIMNCLDDLHFDPYPPVAILPLGTGNDLSRTLGWGSGYAGESLSNILNHIEHSSIVSKLDRWEVKVTPITENGAPQAPFIETVMNNYMSIGIDAKVALEFHSLRKGNPELCASQWMNRFWYMTYGIKAMFDGLEDISKIIKLEVDGMVIPLPEDVEGLIFLNIRHYAGGATTLWGSQDDDSFEEQVQFLPPKLDDKLLEIAAVSSSFHMGQISLELNSAIRLRQGTNIKLTTSTSSPMPIQIDGEPTAILAFSVEIKHKGQALLLEREPSN